MIDDEDTVGTHDVRRRGVATATADRWFVAVLAAISVAAFIVRLVYLVSSKIDDTPVTEQGDAFWYSTTAQNLARGQWVRNLFTGLPTANHPPLTVLVLAPASWLFRDSTFAQRMTMVILGALTVGVIGLAGRRLAGPVAGLAAAGLTAMAPTLWINDALITSETLTALLVALVLWAGVALAEHVNLRLVVVAGALCGLAALSRAETGLFLPFMVWPIVLADRRLDWRRRLGLAAVAAAATAAVVAPWALSNLGRFDEPVTISTNDGLTLLGSNCDTTWHGSLAGGWVLTPCVDDFYATVDDRKGPPTGRERPVPADMAGPSRPCVDQNQKRPPCWDESTLAKVMRGEALDYVRDHLGGLPRVVAIRNARVWGVNRFDQAVGTGRFEGRLQWATRWGFYGTWLLVPVSIAGAVVLYRRRRPLVPFVASIAVVVVVTSVFYGLVRFRIPYDVASCLLGGAAIAALVERRPRPSPAP